MFVDESGDHLSFGERELGKRYLGVLGVAFTEGSYQVFCRDLATLKTKHFGSRAHDVVFHRESIVRRKGDFAVLQDVQRQQLFDKNLLDLLDHSKFTVFAVVIDKLRHRRKRYRKVRHPYHYCLEVVLERYCGWLGALNEQGDVMVEARGRTEDELLRECHREFYRFGTRFLSISKIHSRLLTGDILVRKKEDNEPGLQLADILAHPLTRDVLVSHRCIQPGAHLFADEIVSRLLGKYYKNSRTINGYGRVLLT